MLDVDFLRNRPAFPGPMIYLYRSGVLRRPMLKALAELATAEGRLLDTCTPASFLAGTWTAALWEPSPLVVCDWAPGTIPQASDDALEAMLQGLAERTDQPFALFVPAGSRLTKRPAWPDQGSVIRVVEEAAIGRDTLLPALRYLEMVTDLADRPSFTTQEGFVAHFETMLEDIPDLPTLIRAFDDVVVTATDPCTNRYDQRQLRRTALDKSGHASPRERLRALLTGRDGWDAVRLVALLDARRWQSGRTGASVVADLFRSTARLLDDADGEAHSRVVGTTRLPTVNVVLWAAMLLAFEGDLLLGAKQGAHRARLSADGLTLDLDGLVRAFIARTGTGERTDRLFGLWPDLERTLARVAARKTDELGASRDTLARALTTAVARIVGKTTASWLRRLDACLIAALDEASSPDNASTNVLVAKAGERNWQASGTRHIPATFDEVIGYPHVVEALRSRVQTADHKTNLLLYGPDGVGKRTLARLYAKAVLCELPTPAGTACNACAACQEFDRGGGFGYGYADLTGDDARDRANALVDLARSGTFSRRVVLLIANADQCPPDIFDILLKTLETPRPGVTFVLMGQDLQGMRLAAQSRCMIYRMRPIARATALAHLRADLAAAGVTVDDQVLDVLVAEVGGVAGRLPTAVKTVAALPAVTLTAVRTAFRYDWFEGVAAFWGAVLGDDQPQPEALMPPGADDGLRSRRRMQAVLLRLHPQGAVAHEAALEHRDAVIDDLAGCLDRRANASGRTALRLWGELAQLWLSHDQGDAEGLRRAEQATWDMVSGTR